jgi:hypothetical protein
MAEVIQQKHYSIVAADPISNDCTSLRIKSIELREILPETGEHSTTDIERMPPESFVLGLENGRVHT